MLEKMTKLKNRNLKTWKSKQGNKLLQSSVTLCKNKNIGNKTKSKENERKKILKYRIKKEMLVQTKKE